MTAGLEIYNSHGTVQVNATSHALAYYSRLYISGMVGSNCYFDITPTDATMLAVTSASPCTFIYRIALGGGGWRYHFFWGGGDMEVFRFERMTTPTSNVGLQVFNDAGVCMFDSAQLPAKVVAIFGPAAGSFPVPAGKKYAVVTLARRHQNKYRKWTDDINWYLEQTNFISTFYMTPGWIHFNPAQQLPQLPSAIIPESTPQPPDYVSGPALYYVIDVTGY